MKISSFILPAALTLVHASPAPAGRKAFRPIQFDAPLNWVAGDQLFPGKVQEGFHANLGDYSALSWGYHILAKCVDAEGCTSVLVYQAENSGDTGGRFWFGYTFWGTPADESFYKRSSDSSNVTDSTAWSVVKE